jgi:hypothetical protein
MTRTPLLLAAFAAAALACTVTRDARALGPVDLEIGLKAGAGSTPSNIPSSSPNPLGFGLGGRAGVGLFGFYGGVQAMYYFGGQTDGISVHSAQYGGELGYNLKIAILTIRPQLGIGNFTATTSGAVSAGGVTISGSGSQSSLYLEPGVTGLVSLGTFYVGADVNALLLTSMPQSGGGNGLDVAITAHGQVGVRF